MKDKYYLRDSETNELWCFSYDELTGKVPVDLDVKLI